ncbi:MAG: 5'-3' exonuclease H3TH domain-containing protein, partial [Bryobacteraceae bacterium]
MRAPSLFLIDCFGYIFRAYHARARSGAPLMRTSKGVVTEAVYIFHNMVRKLMEAYHPDYLAAVFEKGPSFREKEFAEYKANREEMPADLGQQIPLVRRLLDTMRIPVLEFEGFEADDVIATIARRASSNGVDVVIVSSDKDLMQLVGERVRMLNPAKEDLWYDEAKVREFLGVTPAQVADLLALKGDSVDNIPGAPGIGEKGARDLIARYGTVEALLERAGEVENKRYRESLQNHRDQVLLSKRLSTVDSSVPIEFDLAATTVTGPDKDALREIYRELEFRSLLAALGPGGPPPGVDYQPLESEEAVKAWIDALGPEAMIGVAVAEEGEGVFRQVSLGLAARTGEGRRIALDAAGPARPLLEDAARPKAAHDVKSVVAALESHGIAARGFDDDVMLYAFLLSADPGVTNPATVAGRYLERSLSGGADELADCVRQLAASLGAEVDGRGLRRTYTTIDLPLVPVLAR